MITNDNLDITVRFSERNYAPDRTMIDATLHLTCGFYVAPGESFEHLKEQAKKAILHKLYGDIEAKVWAARHVAKVAAASSAYDHEALDKAFEAILTPEE